MARLWLAGEVVNHVGIYGSKGAEGLSAFQRRSYYRIVFEIEIFLIQENAFEVIVCNIFTIFFQSFIDQIPDAINSMTENASKVTRPGWIDDFLEIH